MGWKHKRLSTFSFSLSPPWWFRSYLRTVNCNTQFAVWFGLCSWQLFFLFYLFTSIWCQLRKSINSCLNLYLILYSLITSNRNCSSRSFRNCNSRLPFPYYEQISAERKYQYIDENKNRKDRREKQTWMTLYNLRLNSYIPVLELAE